MNITPPAAPWRFCLAPMMRRTDTHFRHLVSLIAPNMRLYTEMLTPNAIIFGDRQKLLGFSVIQSPIALQLGGSDPKTLLESAYIAIDRGYTEINLNCGCPSNRVQSHSSRVRPWAHYLRLRTRRLQHLAVDESPGCRMPQ